MMSDHRQSEEFPEGYGDFRLVSSDGVTFSFHRFLLSHVSPVFEDMLKLGATHSNAQKHQQEQQEREQILLAEGSTTIDQLLRFFDPVKKILPIDSATVERLLEAAQKYQIEQVFEYWEEQMKFRNVGRKITLIRDPMVTFLLAHRFERHELAKLALRELIRAPEAKLSVSQVFMVDSRLIMHITRLRQARSTTLFSRLYVFQKSIIADQGCCYLENIGKTQQQILALVLKLFNEPSWETFRANLDIWSGCKGHYLGSRQLFTAWQKSVMEEEEALPNLPKFSS